MVTATSKEGGEELPEKVFGAGDFSQHGSYSKAALTGKASSFTAVFFAATRLVQYVMAS